MTKRVSFGFDLRVSADLQKQNPAQVNQRLVSGLANPISADPGVWVRTEEVDSLMQEALPDFCNPLGLAKNIDLLVDASRKRGISTAGLSPVCLTSSEANLIALAGRFGPGYFDNQPKEEEILLRGWRLLGFDVVDLLGLISGLKGCGYAEPAWSQLRGYFGAALNEVGLFDDDAVACQFAEVRGLQIREHAPFVVVGILTQDLC